MSDGFEQKARDFLNDNPWLATLCSSHEPVLVAVLAREFRRVAREGAAQSPDPPPEAPFSVEIHAHGETWADALREVLDAARHVEDHGPECERVGGGGGRGGHIIVRTVPGLTPEAYRAALMEWFDRRRPARGGP